MALPENTSRLIEFLRPGVDPISDYIVAESAGGITIEMYSGPGLEPTELELIDAAADLTTVGGKTFSQWYAENGGDPIQTLRRKAKEALDDQASETNAAIRAVVLELLDYCNSQRAKFNTLLAWMGTQTTLLRRGELSALQLTEATATQARIAIKQRITDGDADS